MICLALPLETNQRMCEVYCFTYRMIIDSVGSHWQRCSYRQHRNKQTRFYEWRNHDWHLPGLCWSLPNLYWSLLSLPWRLLSLHWSLLSLHWRLLSLHWNLPSLHWSLSWRVSVLQQSVRDQSDNVVCRAEEAQEEASRLFCLLLRWWVTSLLQVVIV